MFKIILTFLVTAAASSLWAKSLPKLPHKRSVELNVIPAHSIDIANDRILTFVPARDALVLTPFNGLKKSREETFGAFLDSSKIFLKDRDKNFNAHFGVAAGDQVIAFDGESLNVGVYSLKDSKFWRFRDLIYDLILPHADRGGEAPTTEMRKLRAQFTKDIRSTTGLKLSHIRTVPDSMVADASSTSNEFLVSTTLSSAKFVTVHCEKEDKARCMVKRKCSVPLDSRKNANGVAFDAKRKLLAVGVDNTIHLFNYKNCNIISKKDSLIMPKELPFIADVFIDESERLWIATQAKDVHSHGSIFVWEKSEWN